MISDKIWWQTIWEDINCDIEALPLTPISYDAGSLTNKLYLIIDNKDELRRVLLNNNVVGLYKDLQKIRDHCSTIINDKFVRTLIDGIFMRNVELSTIDQVFLNAYYRRLLRARLELDFLNKNLSSSTVITGNKEDDKYIVQALSLLRLICRFLGINSTTTVSTFNSDKLNNDIFWSSISEKLLLIFGENRITLIEEHQDDPLNRPNISKQLQQHETTRSRSFILLNIVFNGWSGSILTIDAKEPSIINIVPATYITRMITKLL